MIWIDFAVILLFTLRMILLRPTLPHLLDPENDSSSLVGNEEVKEYLLVVEGSG
jgi:hypothetical protein